MSGWRWLWSIESWHLIACHTSHCCFHLHLLLHLPLSHHLRGHVVRLWHHRHHWHLVTSSHRHPSHMNRHLSVPHRRLLRVLRHSHRRHLMSKRICLLHFLLLLLSKNLCEWIVFWWLDLVRSLSWNLRGKLSNFTCNLSTWRLCWHLVWRWSCWGLKARPRFLLR